DGGPSSLCGMSTTRRRSGGPGSPTPRSGGRHEADSPEGRPSRPCGQRTHAVHVKPLKVIADERGYLMEMMRNDDPFFQRFGQTYVSVAYPGVVKGWHYHKIQTDHFVIVKGIMKDVMSEQRA